MRKVIAIVAIATLVACGGSSTPTTTTDSTTNAVDTTRQKDTTDYKNQNAARLAELKDSTKK